MQNLSMAASFLWFVNDTNNTDTLFVRWGRCNHINNGVSGFWFPTFVWRMTKYVQKCIALNKFKGVAYIRSKLLCTSMIMIFKRITLQKSQLRWLWKSVGPFYYPGRSRLAHCHGSSRVPPSYLINIKPWRHTDCSLHSRHTPCTPCDW